MRWSGKLVDSEGNPAPLGPELKMFLRAMGTEFSARDELAETAVVAPGDSAIALSAVIKAEDEGSAVNLARNAFEEIIEQAGGKANLPDGAHHSWSVKELVKLIEAEVRELQPA